MYNETLVVELDGPHQTKVYSNTWTRLRLSRFKWRKQVHKRAKKVYVVAYCGGTLVYLHRLITGALPGQVVDHIDGDGLNNTDSNLRVVTPGQNRANSKRDRDNRSGYKGVTWAICSKCWMAQIKARGVTYYLGLFHDKKRAAFAHDRAALALHGQHAGLNFPHLAKHYRPKMPTPSKRRE